MRRCAFVSVLAATSSAFVPVRPPMRLPRSVSAAAIEDQTLDARAAALANHHARASAESIAQADALASHVSATLSAGPLAVHRARHEASLHAQDATHAAALAAAGFVSEPEAPTAPAAAPVVYAPLESDPLRMTALDAHRARETAVLASEVEARFVAVTATLPDGARGEVARPAVAAPSEADSATRIERLKREGEATIAKRMQRLMQYEAMLTKQIADIDAGGAARERGGGDEPEGELALEDFGLEDLELEPEECILDADGNCMDTALGQLLPTASAEAALAQLLTEGVAAPKSKGALEVEKKVKSAPVAVAKKEVVPATAAANKAGAGLTLSQQAELAHVRHMIAGLTLSLESYKVAERQILELGGL